MRKFKPVLIAALAILLPLLSGCARSNQVENQGFVLVMGLDQEEDGQFRMSAQLPKIAGNSDSEGGSSGNSSYTSLSVAAESYEAALQKLEWAVPRELNLAQLKLIVISRDLAEDARFPDIIDALAETNRLFTSAWVAVCEGRAQNFVEAIQPTIGTRLSSDIDATFEHYIRHGFIPGSRLAELYYLSNSVYSAPMMAYALLDEAAQAQKDSETQPAAALSGPPDSLKGSFESEIATHYLGAALFSEGRFAGLLSGTEAILANLLRNELKSLHYESNGGNIELVASSPVRLGVEINDQGTLLKVRGSLVVSSQQTVVNPQELERALENDITQLIQHTQASNCEPFGFAEKAVWKFASMEDWLEFDWKKHFTEAKIDVDLKITRADA